LWYKLRMNTRFTTRHTTHQCVRMLRPPPSPRTLSCAFADPLRAYIIYKCPMSCRFAIKDIEWHWPGSLHFNQFQRVQFICVLHKLVYNFRWTDGYTTHYWNIVIFIKSITTKVQNTCLTIVDHGDKLWLTTLKHSWLWSTVVNHGDQRNWTVLTMVWKQYWLLLVMVSTMFSLSFTMVTRGDMAN